MGTQKAPGQRRGWHLPGRRPAQPPPVTAPAPAAGPPANPVVAVLADLAAARARIIAGGHAMASVRAKERIFRERIAAHRQDPDTDAAALAAEEAALAGLQARVAVFEAMWRLAQPALGLPEPPELAAAEEVALRLQISTQLARGGQEGRGA